MSHGRRWVVVPAAGVGQRMGGAQPKQYLELAGRPLVHWTLEALAPLEAEAILLVVAPGDPYIGALAEALEVQVSRLEILREGGASRAESVAAGLRALAPRAAPEDWVWVHDAARPCVGARALQALSALEEDAEAGALLAQPMDETVKTVTAGRVQGTVDRAALWRAQTPQGATFARLYEALTRALAEAPEEITDEASALERLGLAPRIVLGEASNLKVTHPDDLALATFWLQQHGRWTPTCA
jgi:2-C-methyl-D-erythritol 4-phosphate cytidylyltransferase